jgi:acetolactate synthase-1/2/3 large subunit
LIEAVQPRDCAPWRDEIASFVRPRPEAFSGDLSPEAILASIYETTEGRCTIVTDVGQHQMWVAKHYPYQRANTHITSGGLGTMGFGLPAAIGAALACPERRVVCFTGDGSLLMNIQELATAAEERARITVVLLDNAHLGLVRQQQELFYGGRYHASRFDAAPDFAAIARGFGIEAYDLETSADPTATLARAFDAAGPCVVRVPIAAAANVYPMVRPGGPNREMIDHDAPDATATFDAIEGDDDARSMLP